MRKLLVASQKGGVGKTTTSMNLAAATALSGTRVLLLDADPLSNISTALNLAAHPHRRLLRQAKMDLPGVFVHDIVPQLDVLSPYEGGHCSDDDFERLLRVLTSPTISKCYGCMIVDVPPFLGGNPAQLIGICDDFLLVMRAEALAHRTLPAFLELVQRSSRADHPLPMRGILLTIAEGEEPGCRWERELRGRFGTRVLAEVIPHDARIGESLNAGRINSHVHPDSPAGRPYHQLVSKLGLSVAEGAGAKVEEILQVLREGATLVAPPAAPAPVPEPPKPAAPVHRPRRLSRSSEMLRPTEPERPSPPPAAPSPPLRIKVVPAKVPITEDIPSPPPAASAPPQPTANALAQLWPLWILLGAVLGGGLRLVPLTPSLLPVLVGLGVALLVIVVLFALPAQKRASAQAARRRGQNHTRGREPKKATPRAEPRKDPVAARLAALAGMSKRTRRDVDAN